MTQMIDIALSPNLSPDLAERLASLGNLRVARWEIPLGAHVYVCTDLDSVDTNLINRLPPTLGLIAKVGVGTDHIDLDACRKKGIRVSTIPALTEDNALRLKANITAFIARGFPLDWVR